MIRRPRRSTPFPYTQLFRSGPVDVVAVGVGEHPGVAVGRPDEEQHAVARRHHLPVQLDVPGHGASEHLARDRKSTRLNSSHANISYAVFCLKKKTSNANISY